MRGVYFLAMFLPAMAQAQPVDKDLAIGRQMAAQVETRSKLVADPAVVEYLNRIGQSLALHANLKTPLTLKVIEGNGAQATTLPGGFCYLTTKLIMTAETEAELAGAIAHQIGHMVIWREKGPWTDGTIGTIPLIPASLCLRASLGLAMPMGFINEQRDAEAKADQFGLEYLYQSGYDPAGLADLYERILSQGYRKGSVRPVFMPWSIFPPATRSQADSLRSKMSSYIVTTSGFNDLQQRLRALQPVAPKTPPPTLLH
jgi:predicted Zn-dependent protease